MATTRDANGRIVTTYDDGSYIDGNGGVHNPDGSIVDPATITTTNAQNAAGNAALHQGSIPDGKGGFITYGTGKSIPNNSAQFPYPHYDNGATSAPTLRTATGSETTAASNANTGNDGVGLPGIGGGGDKGSLTVLGGIAGAGLDAIKTAAGNITGSPIGNDVGGDAQTLRDNNQRISDAINNQKPITSPGEATTTVGPTTTSAGSAIDPTASATASHAAGATIDPVAKAIASTAAKGPDAVATTYGGAKIDTGASDQSRAQQQKLVDTLNGAIEGTAPSVAEATLKKAGDQAVAQQYALGASAHGQNVGLGLRAAQQGAAEIGAKNAQDAAILRAQEIATARGQEGDVLSAIRGQDVNLASNQGNLTNTAGIAGAHDLTTTSQFNSGQTTEVNKFNAGNETDIAKTNAQLEADRAKALAQLIQGNNQFNAGADTDVSKLNAEEINKRAAAAAALAQNNTQFNATQTNTATQLQAQLDQKRASDELTAYMQGQQLTVTQMNDLMQALNAGTLGLVNSDTELAKAKADADARKQAAILSALGSLTGGIATIATKPPIPAPT